MSEKKSLGAQFAPVSNRFDPAVRDAIAALRAEGWNKLADKVEILATQKAILPPGRFTFENMGGSRVLSVALLEKDVAAILSASGHYYKALEALGLQQSEYEPVVTIYLSREALDRNLAADKDNPDILRQEMAQIFGRQGGLEVPKNPEAYQQRKSSGYNGYVPPRR